MLKGLDSKKKIELTITGIGVVILIFLAANHMTKLKNGKPVTKSEVASAERIAYSVERRALSVELRESNDEQRATNDGQWGRDPFLLDASNVKEQGMAELSLSR